MERNAGTTIFGRLELIREEASSVGVQVFGPTWAVLDSETGEDILRLLRARCDAGAAGVLVTHEARHAAWADRVVFLRDGVVVDESGRDGPDALLERAR